MRSSGVRFMHKQGIPDLKTKEQLGAMTDAEFKEESKRTVKQLVKSKKFSVLSLLALILLIGGVIAYTVLQGNATYQKETLRGMLMYQRELYADVVISDVMEILGVYNEETYLKAKENSNFDEELRTRLFKDDTYTGGSQTVMPILTLMNIEYDLSNDLNSKQFVLTVKNERDGRCVIQKVYVLVYNDLIADLIISEQKG